jgi:hypothetical protein
LREARPPDQPSPADWFAFCSHQEASRSLGTVFGQVSVLLV